MGAYLIRRLLLVIPTLLGIMLINFFVIQVVPGGPVEQLIAQLSGTAVEATARVAGGGTGETLSAQQDPQNRSAAAQTGSQYRGARGLDPQLIKDIEVMYGLDKPLHIRFVDMMRSYLTFDFGDSFFQDRRVIDIVLDKMPVSISLGLWTTLLGNVRDTCNFVSQRGSSGKVRLFGQHMSTMFSLENQGISHVILQKPFRTLHQLTTGLSFNWYKKVS